MKKYYITIRLVDGSTCSYTRTSDHEHSRDLASEIFDRISEDGVLRIDNNLGAHLLYAEHIIAIQVDRDEE